MRSAPRTHRAKRSTRGRRLRPAGLHRDFGHVVLPAGLEVARVAALVALVAYGVLVLLPLLIELQARSFH